MINIFLLNLLNTLIFILTTSTQNYNKLLCKTSHTKLSSHKIWISKIICNLPFLNIILSYVMNFSCGHMTSTKELIRHVFFNCCKSWKMSVNASECWKSHDRTVCEFEFAGMVAGVELLMLVRIVSVCNKDSVKVVVWTCASEGDR